MFDRFHPGFIEFIRESNRIEGILRDPTQDEIAAHERLMKRRQLSVATVGDFQAAIAPRMPLRSEEGMNVRVGSHTAPEGGVQIVQRLQRLLTQVNQGRGVPWSVHVAFEKLHPYMDGNGRTGRAIWPGKCKDWDEIRSRCRSCIDSIIRRWRQAIYLSGRLRAPDKARPAYAKRLGEAMAQR